eukprot:gnl/MRDRNA2_/MRDRNA2_89959_c0_seq1.p1 gnl/MRDRNA2_/MRDRNA2_89959_c0~~gnl/MRDRNA2_/MRDRNA2_89959_c0_seq1.p1  ORF type:complete len:399 (+),score=86.05 gnl/MRDRNA2_/MRDRNA2_89959_c0_seq1:97-1293(+)
MSISSLSAHVFSQTLPAELNTERDPWLTHDPWQDAAETKMKQQMHRSPAWKRRQRRLRLLSTCLERDTLLSFRAPALAPRLPSEHTPRVQYIAVDKNTHTADISSYISTMAAQMEHLQWKLAGIQHAMQLNQSTMEANLRREVRQTCEDAVRAGLHAFGKSFEEQLSHSTAPGCNVKSQHASASQAAASSTAAVSTAMNLATLAENNVFSPLRKISSSWFGPSLGDSSSEVISNASAHFANELAENPEVSILAQTISQDSNSHQCAESSAQAMAEEQHMEEACTNQGLTHMEPAEACVQETLAHSAGTFKQSDICTPTAAEQEPPFESLAAVTNMACDVRAVMGSLDAMDWGRLCIVSKAHKQNVEFKLDLRKHEAENEHDDEQDDELNERLSRICCQ